MRTSHGSGEHRVDRRACRRPRSVSTTTTGAPVEGAGARPRPTVPRRELGRAQRSAVRATSVARGRVAGGPRRPAGADAGVGERRRGARPRLAAPSRSPTSPSVAGARRGRRRSAPRPPCESRGRAVAPRSALRRLGAGVAGGRRRSRRSVPSSRGARARRAPTTEHARPRPRRRAAHRARRGASAPVGAERIGGATTSRRRVTLVERLDLEQRATDVALVAARRRQPSLVLTFEEGRVPGSAGSRVPDVPASERRGPREMRDRTVPGGTSSTSAISA